MADQLDMLERRDKGLRDSRGVLTHLFRQILFQMNITPFAWDKKMKDYLHNPSNRIPQNSKDKSSARGNLNKELRRDKMSWNVFMKALRFLGPIKIHFEVHLFWAGRKDPTIHRVEIEQQAMDLDIEEGDGG